MARDIKVVGLCGSLRDHSTTRMALTIALDGALEAGARTELIDLRDYDLPFCAGGKTEGPDVDRLKQSVGGAQGIILASPEYHGGYSGVLKNALDLMGFEEFEGKMLGLIGVAGGRMGATNAINGLRIVGRTVRAWVLPTQVSIAQAYQAFDDDGHLKDPDAEQRLRDLGRMTHQYAALHCAQAPEL